MLADITRLLLAVRQPFRQAYGTSTASGMPEEGESTNQSWWMYLMVPEHLQG